MYELIQMTAIFWNYESEGNERKRKRKMGTVGRYIVPMLKLLTGHNVNFHFGCEF